MTTFFSTSSANIPRRIYGKSTENLQEIREKQKQNLPSVLGSGFSKQITICWSSSPSSPNSKLLPTRYIYQNISIIGTHSYKKNLRIFREKRRKKQNLLRFWGLVLVHKQQYVVQVPQNLQCCYQQGKLDQNISLSSPTKTLLLLMHEFCPIWFETSKYG